MRKILVLGLLFGTVGTFASGCTGDDDDDDDDDGGAVTITPANPTVVLGSSLQLTATFDGVAVTTTATWTSATESVATVGANTGLVATLSTGQTVITAAYQGEEGDTTVTVIGTGSTLTFSGSAWPHDGFNAFVRILDDDTGDVVDCQVSAPITDTAFSIEFGRILRIGKSYTYETFADLNDDGNYTQGGGTDHRWTGSINPTGSTTIIDVPHAQTQAALTWQNNAPCPGTP